MHAFRAFAHRSRVKKFHNFHSAEDIYCQRGDVGNEENGSEETVTDKLLGVVEDLKEDDFGMIEEDDSDDRGDKSDDDADMNHREDDRAEWEHDHDDDIKGDDRDNR